MVWLLLSPLLGRKPAGLETCPKQLVTQDITAVCCYLCFPLAKSLPFLFVRDHRGRQEAPCASDNSSC